MACGACPKLPICTRCYVENVTVCTLQSAQAIKCSAFCLDWMSPSLIAENMWRKGLPFLGLCLLFLDFLSDGCGIVHSCSCQRLATHHIPTYTIASAVLQWWFLVHLNTYM
ncbi:hypothetical protein ABZP36_010931 [Zizania latifolia]